MCRGRGAAGRTAHLPQVPSHHGEAPGRLSGRGEPEGHLIANVESLHAVTPRGRVGEIRTLAICGAGTAACPACLGPHGRPRHHHPSASPAWSPAALEPAHRETGSGKNSLQACFHALKANRWIFPELSQDNFSHSHTAAFSSIGTGKAELPEGPREPGRAFLRSTRSFLPLTAVCGPRAIARLHDRTKLHRQPRLGPFWPSAPPVDRDKPAPRGAGSGLTEGAECQHSPEPGP